MADDIDTSVRFLDNVIDANQYPLQEITDLAQQIRRIGNGVMGFADLLIKLRIPYDSRDALDVADTVAEYFTDQCKLASRRLANERGSYPAWDGEGEPQRNCNVTTVAPTGTISMIAGCSGGIEPIFAIGFYRNQAGMNVLDTHPEFANDIRRKYQYSDEEIGQMALGDLPIPKDVNWYRTSSDVSPEMHVRMQGVWQKHICSAISKTINMPKTATVEDVDSAYRLAYDLRCKGVTVYRDGCRPGQVLSTKKVEDDGHRSKTERSREDIKPEKDSKFSGRPSTLDGSTHSIASPIGKMYVTVNRTDGKPYEVFINVGKAGGTSASYSEAVGRLISLGLRRDIKIEEIHRQLRGISSDRAFGFGDGKVASGPDAVAKVLEKYMDVLPEQSKSDAGEFAACPDCHSELTFEEGCYKCHSCGYGGC
jgi:ribonucleoside-diphosphate reductase alpha chain